MTAIAEKPAPPRLRLPTQDDLPYSDGEPMESNWHVLQMDLLRESLKLYWADRQRFFVGSNMFLYFSAERLRSQDFRGPDVFVALDVEDRPRKSWVVWEEGKGPDVVIEFLSETTADIDRTVKKQVYQDQVRVSEYFWYDPESRELAGFTLCDGLYEPILPDERGRLHSPRLGLYLVRWQGEAGREEAEWVRWETPEGILVPSPQEQAAMEQRRADEAERRAAEETRHAAEARLRADEVQRRADEVQRRADEVQRRADEEHRRAEEQRLRAERLAARLRALGVDPEE